MKRKLAKIGYFLLAIIVIGAIGVFLSRSKIFASDLGGGDQQVINLGGSFGQRTVRVNINAGQGKIEIEKNLFTDCNSNLVGFQDEAKIRGTISVSSGDKAVEITAAVGAHSENRQYFTIDKNFCPQPLAFVKDGAISYNIYSDEPNFLLQDFNDDGSTDIAAEYRNYDLNPIVDGTRDIYFFDPKTNQFMFSQTENFQYSTN